MSMQPDHRGSLESVFVTLREEYTEEPPKSLELSLRAQFRRQRWMRHARRWAIGTAAAAALLILGLAAATRQDAPLTHLVPKTAVAVRHDAVVSPPPFVVNRTPGERMQVASTAHSARRHAHRLPEAKSPDENLFVAVPYSEPLAPSEQIDIYRVALPRATLPRYGLPMRAGGGFDSPITADVAVGSDGVVRAIRFVH